MKPVLVALVVAVEASGPLVTSEVLAGGGVLGLLTVGVFRILSGDHAHAAMSSAQRAELASIRADLAQEKHRVDVLQDRLRDEQWRSRVWELRARDAGWGGDPTIVTPGGGTT